MMFAYDFEVFSHDILMTAKAVDGSWTKKIHNDLNEFKKFYEEHKNDIWIGFNSKSYDNRIMQTILNSVDDTQAIKNAWWANGKIIGERNVLALFRKFNMNKYPIIGYDVHLTGDRTLSLKDAEAFLGLQIKESSVPWDIDRPLTHEELKDIFYYNELDVDATIEVFGHRYQNMKDKLMLINDFNLPLTALTYTDTQLTSKIMKASPHDGSDELLPIQPMDWIKLDDEEVIRFYNRPINYDNVLVRHRFGQDIVYAWGGLHSAIDNYIGTSGKYLQIDVSSMYPSWIVKQNHMPRSFNKRMAKEGESWYYDRIHKWKPTGDPRAGTYKLIMNAGWFGASKDENSDSYDPRTANLITVHGQMALTDLIERVCEVGAKLIQANTDGILVEYTDDNYEAILEASKDWEKRSNFELEYDKIDKVWQYDVNNYIVQYPNGKVKVKGARVKESKYADKSSVEFQSSESIVADGIVNYLVNGVDPKKTILDAYKNNEVKAFQQIIKVKKASYDKVIYESPDGTQVDAYYTNRVFASKDKTLGRIKAVKHYTQAERLEMKAKLRANTQKEIEEVKASDRKEAQIEKMVQTRINRYYKNVELIPEVSYKNAGKASAEHQLIFNDALDGVQLKDLNLDYNYYLDKIWKNINDLLEN